MTKVHIAAHVKFPHQVTLDPRNLNYLSQLGQLLANLAADGPADGLPFAFRQKVWEGCTCNPSHLQLSSNYLLNRRYSP